MSLAGPPALRDHAVSDSDDLSRFPKVSKDTLKVTLDEVAVRVGQKEADKKWVCR